MQERTQWHGQTNNIKYDIMLSKTFGVTIIGEWVVSRWMGHPIITLDFCTVITDNGLYAIQISQLHGKYFQLWVRVNANHYGIFKHMSELQYKNHFLCPANV